MMFNGASVRMGWMSTSSAAVHEFMPEKSGAGAENVGAGHELINDSPGL